jgi:hypothetical protein
MEDCYQNCRYPSRSSEKHDRMFRSRSPGAALRTTLSAVLVSLLIVAGTSPAGAHQSPATCSQNGVDIAIGAFLAGGQCAGGTNVGEPCFQDSECPSSNCTALPLPGSLVTSECETVRYNVSLRRSGVSGACDYEAGQLTITTPDLVVHDVTASVSQCVGGSNAGATCSQSSECPGGVCQIPCIGGTNSVSPCDPNLTQVTSAFVTYTIRPQDTHKCAGGANAGAQCGNDSECPASTCQFSGTCLAGTSIGAPCSCDSQCPGSRCAATVRALANYDQGTLHEAEPDTINGAFGGTQNNRRPGTCNDCLPCNGVEICDPTAQVGSRQGQCGPGTAVVCNPPGPDQNFCTPQSCDSTTGQCADGASNVVCDPPGPDQNLCTPQSCDSTTGQCADGAQNVHCGTFPDSCCLAATGQCSTDPPECHTESTLRHFQCYEVDREAFPLRSVDLVDPDPQFGSSTSTISRMKRFCNPANKNGGDPSAVDAPEHLAGYQIDSTAPRFKFLTAYKVIDQFGEMTLTLVKPDLVMVPTAKSLSGPPGSPTFTFDHFQCFRVKLARKRVTGVNVVDQFNPNGLTVNVNRPLRLCRPVDKNGEGIPDPVHQLMCYQVRQTSKPRFSRRAPFFIDNQFGPAALPPGPGTIVVTRPTELCVPSAIIGPVCGDNTVSGTETCDPPGSPCGTGGTCASDCTCASAPNPTPTPGCGNNVIDPGEDCDPPGSSCITGGECDIDCTCPPS